MVLFKLTNGPHSAGVLSWLSIFGGLDSAGISQTG